MVEVSRNNSLPLKTQARAWLELARISNLPTAWTNVLAGWLLVGGQVADTLLGWLLLGASLLYSGGMVLNDAADAAFDSEHKRERPIPSGRVTARAAWLGGGGMLLAGGFLCSLLGGANGGLTVLLILAILAYDLYHKPWAGAVLVMGLCRSLLYLVAGSAVGVPSIHVAGGVPQNKSLISVSSVGPQGEWTWSLPRADFGLPSLRLDVPLHGALWLGAVAIGAYIVGLTMVARLEGRRGKASMGEVLLSRGLLYTPGFLAAWHLMSGGDLKMGVLIVAFAVLIGWTSRIMRRGGPEIGRAVGWLLAGIALVDSLAVAPVNFPLACVFALSVPMLRLWQRKIAAT